MYVDVVCVSPAFFAMYVSVFFAAEFASGLQPRIEPRGKISTV